MARGQEAKAYVVEKIKQAFGSDYVGESAGKHYVWSQEGGERVQIAIALTRASKPLLGEIDMSSAFGDGIDFTAAPVAVATSSAPAEITEEEKQNIVELMARLNL